MTDAAADVSFLDALKGRYGAEDDINKYDPDAFLVGDAGRRRNRKWELVGMEQTRAKQSRYDRLINVSLKNENISVAVKASEKHGNVAKTEGEDNSGNKGSSGGDGSTTKETVTYADELAAQRMMALTELDLSENTRLPLREIAKLVAYFPRLETLQLCDMPHLLPAFSSSLSEAAQTSDGSSQKETGDTCVLSSEKLRKLVLNNTGFVSLVQLRCVLDAPNLVELHLDANGLSNLVIAASEEEEAFLAQKGGDAWLQFPTVRTLSLARNTISSWEVLSDAITRAFPGLQQLFLTENALPNLVLPDGIVAAVVAKTQEMAKPEEKDKLPYVIADIAPELARTYAFLKPLTLLGISDNATITDTRTLDAVRTLCPALQVFRVTYSALLPRWNDTLSRMFTVASLPTLQLLNRGQVRPKERLDSEIFYIQRGLAQREALEAARQKEAAGGPDADGAVRAAMDMFAGEPEYPLLDPLREKHKDLVLSIYKAGATASSDGSSHLMLDVRLRCENNYQHLEGKAGLESAAPNMFQEVRHTLPSNLPVARLKALLKAAFQVDLPNQEISYRSGDDGVLDRPVVMDNELQTLGYYGVGNGAIITVRDTSLR